MLAHCRSGLRGGAPTLFAPPRMPAEGAEAQRA